MIRTTLALTCFAATLSAQVSGTVTSAATGEPLRDVLVMGQSLNWASSDAQGRYTLKERSKTVTFRLDGYRPVTKVVDSLSLDVALEDGRPTEWKIPLCRDHKGSGLLCGRGLLAKARIDIGGEMRFWLPCGLDRPQGYSDIDYSGDVIKSPAKKSTAFLRTMVGPFVSSGRPADDLYLNSTSFEQRSVRIEGSGQRFDGMDAHGVSKDGTYWRWVGPPLGEFAEYRSASLEEAKYFDAILDSACYHPMN